MAKQKLAVYDYSLVKEIQDLTSQGETLLQISYTLNLSYLELKQYLTDFAIDEKAAKGNSTAVQIQMKRNDEKTFQNIKHEVWDLSNTI